MFWIPVTAAVAGLTANIRTFVTSIVTGFTSVSKVKVMIPYFLFKLHDSSWGPLTQDNDVVEPGNLVVYPLGQEKHAAAVLFPYDGLNVPSGQSVQLVDEFCTE